jgi:hypothetical protein
MEAAGNQQYAHTVLIGPVVQDMSKVVELRVANRLGREEIMLFELNAIESRSMGQC